jgi:ubiquitin C-terminal hydrolase
VEQMMQFEEKRPLGAGLKNVGNSCYLNSVLQCVIYTPAMLTYLLTCDHAKGCTQQPFCALCEIEEHAKTVLDPQYAWITPIEFLNNLKHLGDFYLYNQEDAHEFASSILNRTHRVLYQQYKDSFIKQNPGVPFAIDKEDEMRIEETTVIYQLLGGTLQSQVKCEKCGNVNGSLESFLDLNLDLSQNALSVEEALMNFVRIEKLDESTGYRCDKCNQAVPAQKQLTIYSPPNILMVQLKRFDMMRGGLKINKPITFTEEFDLKSALSAESKEVEDAGYSLYAVLVHYGETCYSGHYTCFVKHQAQWHLFDDEKVTRNVSPAVVLKQNAYILFYKKNKPNSRTTSASAPLNKSSENTSAASVPVISTANKKKNKRKGNATSAATVPESNDQKSSLSVSSEVPLNSSGEVKSPSVTARPKCRAYYRTKEDDAIEDLVIKMQLTDLNSDAQLSLDVKSSGEVNLVDPSNKYQFSTVLPFPLDAKKSSAQYFAADKTLVAVLSTQFEESSGSSGAVTAQQTEEASSSTDWRVHEENEVPLEDERNKPVLSMKEAQQAVENVNASIREAKYGNLYQVIRETREREEQSTVPSVRSAPPSAPPKESKVNRNDVCPCGSGKKYKKCHGK